MRFAAAELGRPAAMRLLDIGCGAARNAAPLAALGWQVFALDLSWPMVQAARDRARGTGQADRLHVALAPMEALPVHDRSMDLVVAHGIWNLASSSSQFRTAVREAARVCRPGAGLFVFTFSRNTFGPDVEPVAGEPFVYTQFSGRPQCFLTAEQLIGELEAVGFVPDPTVPLTEYNLPLPGRIRPGGPPVIYEAAFRFVAAE